MTMKIVQRFPTEVLLLEPEVCSDHRGYFFETYNELEGVLLGVNQRFVQDNQSHSIRNVLRGLHYQIRHPQGKLVRVLQGEIYDVSVDLRRCSLSFGEWTGALLSAENRHMMWIPPGFAHGFLVLSDSADVDYKATDHYAPQYERTIRWDDRELGIEWPIAGAPVLSNKDRAGTPFRMAEVYDWLLQPPPPVGPIVGPMRL
jgi:dTDP-4-dehydrorhamnose 3,5-epimerase